jgi:oligoribonuclease
MNTAETRIIWGDVETTGVNAFEGDVLLEAAFLVTDGDLNILDEAGYQAVVLYSPKHVTRLKQATSDFVLNMHEKTGLWDRLQFGRPQEQIDAEALAYLKQFVPEAKTARFAGNSITLDRNFMQANLPGTFEHIHYRSFDVSTVAGLAQMWGGEEIQYQKKTLHSAFSDITESIEELRYLRSKAFKF